MTGRLKGFPHLTGEQASGVLKWLVVTGRVRNAQIRKAIRDRDELVAEVKSRLEALGGEGLKFLTGPAAIQRRPKRRRRKASAKARAAWRAQGRYLAAVKGLSKADRLRIRTFREKNGVAKAIAAAKRLAT